MTTRCRGTGIRDAVDSRTRSERKGRCGATLTAASRKTARDSRPGTAAVRVGSTALGRGGGLPLTARLSDGYFDRMYCRVGRSMATAVEVVRAAQVCDHAGVVALCALPARVRTRLLDRRADRAAGRRCDHVTGTDVATAALDATHRTAGQAGRRERVTLLQASLDEPWPLTGCRSGRAVGGLLLHRSRRAARGPGPRGAAVGARCDRHRRALAPSGRRLPDER